MDEVLNDKRFAHVAKDPRFRKMPVGERKVKIDTRFKQMFKDKKFKMKYSVDKRGRPINLSTNENLKKYYELSDKESSDDDDEEDSEGDDDKTVEEKQKEQKKKGTEKMTSKKEKQKNKKAQTALAKESDDSSEESESDDEPVNKSGVDFARGEGNVYSSSSDSEEGDTTDDEDDDTQDQSKIDHKWGEADDNLTEVEEATCRLAICNMDWDRVKAKDIYVLLNSFTPTTGLIKSVKIYPSEFGKERMAEEEKQGPRELTEVKLDDNSDDEDDNDDLVDKEGTQYHMEKLREYQLKRLRYFYAVVDCDSVGTADQIYKESDGMEYESTSTKLDLRFIPDDMEFCESEVAGTCTEAPPGYKPQFFCNAALSQSKVDLTWDETDRDRVQLTTQQFTAGKGEEVQEDDLRAYLASSSDEEGPDYGSLLAGADDDSDGEQETEDKQINKYKKLLLDIDSSDKKKERDVSMEITWEPGLRETTDNIVKKKKKAEKSSVWDEYLEKKKEKRRKKMEERRKKKQQIQEDDDVVNEERQQAVEGDQEAFSDDEVPAGVDMADPFFSQELGDTGKQKKNKKKDKKKKKKKGTEETGNTQEKAELSLLMMDGEAEDKKHFNYNDLVQQEDKKKKKGKKGKGKQPGSQAQEEDFQVDVQDTRFAAVYDSHLFNIDPSAPEFKKTKGTEAIISEKLKRSDNKHKNKRTNTDVKNMDIKKAKMDIKPTVSEDSLASLVKSVKAKTKHFQSNKTKR